MLIRILNPSLSYPRLQGSRRVLQVFTLLFLSAGFSLLAPTPSTHSRYLRFLALLWALGASTLWEASLWSFCLLVPFGFRQREAQVRDQRVARGDWLPAVPGAILFLHGHHSCWSGWEEAASSKSLALTWPRNTIFSPFPFQTQGWSCLPAIENYSQH